jgi:hypothetical protein
MSISQTVSNSSPAFRPRDRVPLRICAIAGSAGLAGSLFYRHAGAQIGGQPAWLIAGLLYAAAVGLTAAFIFRFFPKLGPFMELTSISRLLLAIASAVSPKIAVALVTSPALNATMIVLGAVLIRAAARSGWPRRSHTGYRLRTSRPAQSSGGV